MKERERSVTYQSRGRKNVMELEQLSVLVQRESEQRRRRRQERLKVAKEKRDNVVTWLHEVCLEQNLPTRIFARAVKVLDAFLSVRLVLPSQLQLLAVSCYYLASKCDENGNPDALQTLLEYTERAIQTDEVKSWEVMILNTMEWSVDFVTVCDYLGPISKVTQTSPQNKEGQMTNAELVASLCLRNADFVDCHQDKCVAAAAHSLTSSGCHRWEEILKCLRLSQEEVKECGDSMEKLLRVKLEEEKQKVSPVLSTPSGSPLKTENTSTPKSTREPLSPSNLASVRNHRRALMLCNLPEEENKENNDSAIGLLNASQSSPKSSSSSTSKTCSPDSGASSHSPTGSAKNFNDDDELCSVTQTLSTQVLRE